MVLRVDNHEEIKAPYLRCTNAGCEVQVELTAELVAQLKGGLKLRVGIRPFGSLKTVVIDASLEGFTRAFNRLMRYFCNHPPVIIYSRLLNHLASRCEAGKSY